MSRDEHFVALERMFRHAPINDFYGPTIEVSEGEATIEIEVTEKMFHAAGAAHGSVIFKMLDDAAFFAANSVQREMFVLTSSFTTYLLRPIRSGTLRAVGRLVSRTRTQYLAEAIAYDAKGREVGRGSGMFVRGKTPLREVPGYDPKE